MLASHAHKVGGTIKRPLPGGGTKKARRSEPLCLLRTDYNLSVMSRDDILLGTIPANSTIIATFGNGFAARLPDGSVKRYEAIPTRDGYNVVVSTIPKFEIKMAVI